MATASLVPVANAKESLQHFLTLLGKCQVPQSVKSATVSLYGYLADHKELIGFTAVACFAVAKWWKRRTLRKKWDEVGKDVVVLHTLPRGIYYPCLSPFSVKLETFFKMMNIPYVLDFEAPLGYPMKLPWITLNGFDYSDSEAIIQMLLMKMNMQPVVSPMEQSIETSMRIMMEEHFYWGMAHWRYVVDGCDSVFKHHDTPIFNKLIMKFIVTRVMYCAVLLQGIGRHSESNLEEILMKDLEALSTYLGSKPFFHGDEPQVIDCSMFAILSQVLYNMPSSALAVYIRDGFPNLQRYTERMKMRFWGDWSTEFYPLPNVD